MSLVLKLCLSRIMCCVPQGGERSSAISDASRLSTAPSRRSKLATCRGIGKKQEQQESSACMMGWSCVQAGWCACGPQEGQHSSAMSDASRPSTAASRRSRLATCRGIGKKAVHVVDSCA
jgi:hypothetical protein